MRTLADAPSHFSGFCIEERRLWPPFDENVKSDTSIQIGAGANGEGYSIVPQPDGVPPTSAVLQNPNSVSSYPPLYHQSGGSCPQYFYFPEHYALGYSSLSEGIESRNNAQLPPILPDVNLKATNQYAQGGYRSLPQLSTINLSAMNHHQGNLTSQSLIEAHAPHPFQQHNSGYVQPVPSRHLPLHFVSAPLYHQSGVVGELLATGSTSNASPVAARGPLISPKASSSFEISRNLSMDLANMVDPPVSWNEMTHDISGIYAATSNKKEHPAFSGDDSPTGQSSTKQSDVATKEFLPFANESLWRGGTHVVQTPPFTFNNPLIYPYSQLNRGISGGINVDDDGGQHTSGSNLKDDASYHASYMHPQLGPPGQQQRQLISSKAAQFLTWNHVGAAPSAFYNFRSKVMACNSFGFCEVDESKVFGCSNPDHNQSCRQDVEYPVPFRLEGSSEVFTNIVAGREQPSGFRQSYWAQYDPLFHHSVSLPHKGSGIIPTPYYYTGEISSNGSNSLSFVSVGDKGFNNGILDRSSVILHPDNTSNTGAFGVFENFSTVPLSRYLELPQGLPPSKTNVLEPPCFPSRFLMEDKSLEAQFLRYSADSPEQFKEPMNGDLSLQDSIYSRLQLSEKRDFRKENIPFYVTPSSDLLDKKPVENSLNLPPVLDDLYGMKTSSTRSCRLSIPENSSSRSSLQLRNKKVAGSFSVPVSSERYTSGFPMIRFSATRSIPCRFRVSHLIMPPDIQLPEAAAPLIKKESSFSENFHKVTSEVKPASGHFPNPTASENSNTGISTSSLSRNMNSLPLDWNGFLSTDGLGNSEKPSEKSLYLQSFPEALADFGNDDIVVPSSSLSPANDTSVNGPQAAVSARSFARLADGVFLRELPITWGDDKVITHYSPGSLDINYGGNSVENVVLDVEPTVGKDRNEISTGVLFTMENESNCSYYHGGLEYPLESDSPSSFLKTEKMNAKLHHSGLLNGTGNLIFSTGGNHQDREVMASNEISGDTDVMTIKADDVSSKYNLNTQAGPNAESPDSQCLVQAVTSNVPLDSSVLYEPPSGCRKTAKTALKSVNSSILTSRSQAILDSFATTEQDLYGSAASRLRQIESSFLDQGVHRLMEAAFLGNSLKPLYHPAGSKSADILLGLPSKKVILEKRELSQGATEAPTCGGGASEAINAKYTNSQNNTSIPCNNTEDASSSTWDIPLQFEVPQSPSIVSGGKLLEIGKLSVNYDAVSAGDHSFSHVEAEEKNKSIMKESIPMYENPEASCDTSFFGFFSSSDKLFDTLSPSYVKNSQYTRPVVEHKVRDPSLEFNEYSEYGSNYEAGFSAEEHIAKSGVSEGNLLHPYNCKPCAFHWGKGCANSSNCNFCHEWHPVKKKKSMKEQKNLMIIARDDEKLEFIRCTYEEAIATIGFF